MNNRIVLFLILFGVSVISFSQNDLRVRLNEIIESKNTYSEISKEFNSYLDTVPESYEKFKLQKHFSRWANYQSLHLDGDGDFVNIPQMTFEAVEKASTQMRSSNGNWTFVGPASSTTNNPVADLNGIGRVDRIAFHPTDPDILFIGTPAGGLWKTTDGGNSWNSLSSFIPSLGISGIVIDHDDPEIIYILTGTGDSYVENYFVNISGYIRKSIGVLVSYNGGVDWQQTGPLSANDFYGYRLIQHPTNSNILFAATSDGLYRTIDGGDNWVLENAGKHYDVKFKPGFPSKVYATGDGAFYYSDDTGDIWNDDATFSHSLCANKRVDIAVSPASDSRVYLLASPKGVGNTFCGLFRSTNSGSDFTRLTTSPNIFGSLYDLSSDQSQYDMGISVCPTNADTVVTCGVVVWRSNDGGSNFSEATSYRESGGNYIHPDIHSVEFNPLDGKLYACTDGGVHVSEDRGDNWTDIYTGINTSQIWHLDDFDGDENVILAGAQDNGIKYRSTDTSDFSHIYCCDGGDMVINYSNQNRGFAALNNKVFEYSNFTASSPNEIGSGGFFMQIELHSSNTNTLYISSNTVNAYTVSAGTFTQIGANSIKGHWSLKTCPSNSNRIYCAGGVSAFAETGKMFRSDDNGTSWDTISNSPGFPANFPRISEIGVRPTNSAHVYACISGYVEGSKVYYSTNAGDNWTNISYDLPNVPVWSIEVDDNNNVYVGTDIGVYVKPSGATEWEPFYNNIPTAPVSDLALNQTTGQLLASTFGRGIWKSDTYGGCAANIVINSEVSGKYFQTATNSVTMNSNVVGGQGTDVILRSENYVDLEPGFRIESDKGNQFLADLGDCQQGVPDNFGSFPAPILKKYNIVLARDKGTLEIIDKSGIPTIRARIFKPGESVIVMMNQNGDYVNELSSIRMSAGEYDFPLPKEELKEDTYMVYLMVDNEVTHLQEYYPTSDFNKKENKLNTYELGNAKR